MKELKNSKNIFTNNKCNNIMNKDYNPLKVNCKIYESEGLFMEGEIFNVVKKLSKKYNKKEMLILEMIKKCKMFGYNIKETERLIKEFQGKYICY